jgi:hypothetical protein
MSGNIPYHMRMLLGFKTQLKLNNQQRTDLLKHCGVARHAWNWGCCSKWCEDGG